MNEETFKNTVIVPLLTKIGFSPTDLEFETSFTIQLGRGRHKVEGKSAGGRLDILCRQGGKNVLVAELKAPGESVGREEARQALSYARLLEPMARYTLVSNGLETALYDTITGKPATLAPGPGFEAGLQEEIALRFDALQSFVGYSAANLLAFSRSQIGGMLRRFAAKPTDPVARQLESKYVPSLFIERARLDEAFRVFMASPGEVVFPLIGDSGSGKTALICHWASTLKTPSLLYSGTLLGPSLLAEMGLDFQTTFSADEGELSALKKVARLAKGSDVPFLIFVDALDEWTARDKAEQLSRIAHACAQLGLKLCVACKASHWDAFLSVRDILRPLADYVVDVPRVEDFNDVEARAALKRYVQALSLATSERSMPRALRHPFSLRVAAEVSLQTGRPVESCADTRDTLDRFIKLSIRKLSSPDLGRRLVREAAKTMLALDQPQIEIDHLKQALRLSILDEIPEEVFSGGLLYKATIPHGLTLVGFYHASIRHYVAGHWIADLKSMASTARQSWIEGHADNAIARDAILHYFQTGTVEDQRDTILAAMAHDKKTGDVLTASLLSWRGESWHRGSLEGLREALEGSLFVSFQRATTTSTAAQAVDAAIAAADAIDSEEICARMFEHIASQPEGECAGTLQCEKLAAHLSRYSTSTVTSRLIAIARDRNVDGYVRRYAVDALDGRDIEDRAQLFQDLLTDGEPNVAAWVRGWYGSVETPEFRDALLAEVARGCPAGVAEEIVTALADSRLPDTAQKLFELRSLVAPKTRGWIYRTLTQLGYRDVVPELLEIISAEPDGDEAKSALLALVDAPEPTVATTLLNVAQSHAGKLSKSRNLYWLAAALTAAASPADWDTVRSWFGSPDPLLARVAGLIAGRSNRPELRILVLRAVADSEDAEHLFSSLMLLDESAPALSVEERRLLHRIAQRGTDVSVHAIHALGTIPEEAEHLSATLRAIVPHLEIDLNWMVGSSMYWPDECRDLLSERLDPWIGEQLRSGVVGAREDSLLVLSYHVGGERTLDALRTQRSAWIAAGKEEQFRAVEHEIERRQGKTQRSGDEPPPSGG